jgi:GNAT superfamily N-acetyltransferase
MAVIIRCLEESDETGNFDCDDAPLNNYLNKYAWVNQEKSSIGVTYVAVEEAMPRRVLGYFTIAMSSVPWEAFPQKYVRGLPNYDLPLILLAQLAVDLRFAAKGIGHALISEAFRISLRVSGEVGCRCVITDAYRDRVSWYARYGFRLYPNRGGRGRRPSENVPRYANDSEGTAVPVVDLRVVAGAGHAVPSAETEHKRRLLI